jgi:hypothetical protein
MRMTLGQVEHRLIRGHVVPAGMSSLFEQQVPGR